MVSTRERGMFCVDFRMPLWRWIVMAAIVLQLASVAATEDKAVYVTVDGTATLHFSVARQKTILYLYKMDFYAGSHDYSRVGFFNPTDMTLLAMDIYGQRLTFVGSVQPWNVTVRLQNARKGDSGFYVCSHEDSPPSVFLHQGVRVDRGVELVVLDKPEKPYVTFDPVNPVKGHGIIFTCMTGRSPRFSKVSWRVGSEILEVKGSNVLPVPNVSVKMTRRDISCSGTNLGGTASPRSDPVQVEVLCTQEPENLTVYVTEQGHEKHIGLRLPPMDSHLGGLLILAPDCQTLVEVQYTHQGIEEILGPRHTGQADNFAIEYSPEMTFVTFTVRHAGRQDAGFYLCVDKASNEPVDNCGVLLIVRGHTTSPRLEATRQPVHKEPVTLVCSVRCDTLPPNQSNLRYSFFRNGSLMVNQTDSPRWTFRANVRWTGAPYRCVVFDGEQELRSLNLTMSPDYVEPDLHITNMSKDGRMTLYCHADCKPNCQVVWRGTHGPVLDLEPDEVTLTQHHTCLASNYVGYASKTHTMLGHPKVVTFYVSKGNDLDKLKVNDSVTLTCVSDAHFASAILDGHMEEQVTESRVHVSRHRLREGMRSLHLDPLQCQHNGDYLCKVYNAEIKNLSLPDCEKHDIAGIRINVPCAPELSPVTARQDNVYRDEGESLWLQVFLAAFPPPDMSWHRKFHDGTTSNVTDVISGSHLRSLPLYIERIDKASFGEYFLLASNEHGELKKSFTLRHRTGRVKPVISLTEGAKDISSIALHWRAFYTTKSDVFFLITLYLEDDDQEVESFEVAMPQYCCDHVLEDLQPDTAYRVEVTVVNGAGARSPSKFLTCRTASDSGYRDAASHMKTAALVLVGLAGFIILLYAVYRLIYRMLGVGIPWVQLPPAGPDAIPMEDLAPGGQEEEAAQDNDYSDDPEGEDPL